MQARASRESYNPGRSGLQGRASPLRVKSPEPRTDQPALPATSARSLRSSTAASNAHGLRLELRGSKALASARLPRTAEAVPRSRTQSATPAKPRRAESETPRAPDQPVGPA